MTKKKNPQGYPHHTWPGTKRKRELWKADVPHQRTVPGTVKAISAANQEYANHFGREREGNGVFRKAYIGPGPSRSITARPKKTRSGEVRKNKWIQGGGKGVPRAPWPGTRKTGGSS